MSCVIPSSFKLLSSFDQDKESRIIISIFLYKLLSYSFYQLLSSFDHEHARGIETILVQTLVYQLSSTFIFVFMARSNTHQLPSLFDQEQGKSKQLSYKLLSTNSHLRFTRSKKSQNNSLIQMKVMSLINLKLDQSI